MLLQYYVPSTEVADSAGSHRVLTTRYDITFCRDWPMPPRKPSSVIFDLLTSPKKSKFILFFLLSSFVLPAAALTPIWGAQATSGNADGEFQNAFVNTTTASNYDPTQWSALSVYDTGGSVTPGAAYWIRTVTGYSQGAYYGAAVPIASDSAANGAAIFDSDYLDNGGVPNAFGTGTSPTAHKGELISPRIDATGATDQAVAVEFFYELRNFQTTEMSVSLSVDDGANWDTVNLPLSGANATEEGFFTASFPAITSGVSNLTQARVKFTFDGDYYYWIVDDVSLGILTPLDTIRLNAGTANTITAAQLNAVDGVSGAVVANEAAYQAAIAAATAAELDTAAEVLAMVNSVNAAAAPAPGVEPVSLPATGLLGQLILMMMLMGAGIRALRSRS